MATAATPRAYTSAADRCRYTATAPGASTRHVAHGLSKCAADRRFATNLPACEPGSRATGSELSAIARGTSRIAPIRSIRRGRSWLPGGYRSAILTIGRPVVTHQPHEHVRPVVRQSEYTVIALDVWHVESERPEFARNGLPHRHGWPESKCDSRPERYGQGCQDNCTYTADDEPASASVVRSGGSSGSTSRARQSVSGGSPSRGRRLVRRCQRRWHLRRRLWRCSACQFSPQRRWASRAGDATRATNDTRSAWATTSRQRRPGGPDRPRRLTHVGGQHRRRRASPCASADFGRASGT